MEQTIRDSDKMRLKLTGLKLRMGTFFGCLKLSALCNFNCLRGLVSHALWHILNFRDDIHAF